MKFTDFINQINESKDFDTELVFEDEKKSKKMDISSVISEQANIIDSSKIYISAKDLCDMFGESYPDSAKEIPEFINPYKYSVGYEKNQINPYIADLIHNWKSSADRPVMKFVGIKGMESEELSESTKLFEAPWNIAGVDKNDLDGLPGVGEWQEHNDKLYYIPRNLVYQDDPEKIQNWISSYDQVMSSWGLPTAKKFGILDNWKDTTKPTEVSYAVDEIMYMRETDGGKNPHPEGLWMDPMGYVHIYNSNSYSVDFFYTMMASANDVGIAASKGTTELVDLVQRGIIKGATGQADEFIDFSKYGDIAVDKLFEPSGDMLSGFVDQHERDEVRNTASAVREGGDWIKLITGQTGFSFSGLGLLVAGEAIPEMVTAAMLRSPKRAGLLMAAGYNAAEAVAFSAIESDEEIKQLWDDKKIDQTMLDLAKIAHPYNEDLQLSYIQNIAKNYSLPATAVLAGGLDTIVDKMTFGRGNYNVATSNVIRRLTSGIGLEGLQEGGEQFLVNLGVNIARGRYTTKDGEEITIFDPDGRFIEDALTPEQEINLFRDVQNAVYNGAITQAGLGAVGETTRGGEALYNYIRNRSENDPDFKKSIEQAMEDALSDADINTIYDTIGLVGGERGLVGKYADIPTYDQLSTQHKKDLESNNEIFYNGRRVTKDQVDLVSDPETRKKLAIASYIEIDAGAESTAEWDILYKDFYNDDGTPKDANNLEFIKKLENGELTPEVDPRPVRDAPVSLNIRTEEELRNFGTLLGIEESDSLDKEKLRREVERTTDFNTNYLQISPQPDSIKTWNELSDSEQAELLTRGFYEFKPGFGVEIDYIVQQSLKEGQTLPENHILNNVSNRVLGFAPGWNNLSDEQQQQLLSGEKINPFTGDNSWKSFDLDQVINTSIISNQQIPVEDNFEIQQVLVNRVNNLADNRIAYFDRNAGGTFAYYDKNGTELYTGSFSDGDTIQFGIPSKTQFDNLTNVANTLQKDYIPSIVMPNENDPSYEIEFLRQQVELNSGVTQQAAQRQLDLALKNLSDDQEAWREEFGETHNEDGTPKNPENNPYIIEPEEQATDDPVIDASNTGFGLATSPVQDVTPPESKGPEVTTSDPTISEPPEGDKTDVNVSTKVDYELPGMVSRPDRGAQVEIDGQTYRFLGRMWAPVKSDGSLGSTGVIGQDSNPTTQELNDTWRNQQADFSGQDIESEKEFDPLPLITSVDAVNNLEVGDSFTYTDNTTGIQLTGKYDGFEDGIIKFTTSAGPEELELDSTTDFSIDINPPTKTDTTTEPAPEVQTDVTGIAPSGPSGDVSDETPNIDSRTDVTVTRKTPTGLTPPPIETPVTPPPKEDPFVDTTLQTPELQLDPPVPSEFETPPTSVPTGETEPPEITTPPTPQDDTSKDKAAADKEASTDFKPVDVVPTTRGDKRGKPETQNQQKSQTSQSDLDKDFTKVEPITKTEPTLPKEITLPPTITPTTQTDTQTDTTANPQTTKTPFGSALDKAAKDAGKFKAIQVYDPLQLKRSEKYLNK